MVLAFIVILASLAFLIFFAYRGHSVIFIAPVAAMIAVLFSGAATVLPGHGAPWVDGVLKAAERARPIGEH